MCTYDVLSFCTWQIIVHMAFKHRRLQAWAYQGNARVDDASHAYDLGFTIVEKQPK